MHYHQQTILAGGVADCRCHARCDDRQIPILPEAALEVGLYANGAASLVGGDGGRRAMILRLELGGNAGGLRRVIKKIRKELESQGRWREGHRIAVRKWQRWAAVIEIGVK